MRKFFVLLLALIVVVGFGACSKPAAKAPEAAPKVDAPAPAPAPAPKAPAAPAAPTAAPATAPAAAPAGGDTALVGTKWQFDQVVLDVKDATTIKVTGGPVEKIAPSGLDVKYTLKDGVFNATFMGKPVPGTFDGTNLVIDGKTAVRQQ